MMPVMDGFQFRALQREDPRFAGIPVVVISAAGERAAPIDGITTVPKPVDLARLIGIVRHYCKGAI
jgi:CheY-like chemotaxis protein